MDLENKDIQLIEQYLLGQLSGEELRAFEQRMQDEPDFAEEVALYSDVIKGVEQHGRDSMKAGLAVMMTSMEASGTEAESYQPSEKPKPKGGSAGGGARWLGSLILVGGAVLLYLWQTGQWHQLEQVWDDLPVINPQEQKPAPKKEEPKVVYEIKRDTVIQEKRETIYTQKQVIKRDTVWDVQYQIPEGAREVDIEEFAIPLPDSATSIQEYRDTFN